VLVELLRLMRFRQLEKRLIDVVFQTLTLESPICQPSTLELVQDFGNCNAMPVPQLHRPSAASLGTGIKIFLHFFSADNVFVRLGTLHTAQREIFCGRRLFPRHGEFGQATVSVSSLVVGELIGTEQDGVKGKPAKLERSAE
jgi:hypothetical protein